MTRLLKRSRDNHQMTMGCKGHPEAGGKERGSQNWEGKRRGECLRWPGLRRTKVRRNKSQREQNLKGESRLFHLPGISEFTTSPPAKLPREATMLSHLHPCQPSLTKYFPLQLTFLLLVKIILKKRNTVRRHSPSLQPHSKAAVAPISQSGYPASSALFLPS